MLGNIIYELLSDLHYAVKRPLTIIETGTMYIDWLEPGERDLMARSTFAIAKWMSSYGGSEFHSIDSCASHISTSRKVLAWHGFPTPEYHCVDSVNALGALSALGLQADFVLLDSDSDPEVILQEYKHARRMVREPGIMVIDDIFKVGERVNKGKSALPYAKTHDRRKYWGIRNQCAAIAFGAAAEPIIRDFPGAYEIDDNFERVEESK